jgi:hypothetical protein
LEGLLHDILTTGRHPQLKAVALRVIKGAITGGSIDRNELVST